MFLLYDKRKKESLMKFPTFIEVKLNGYMGGGEKISSNSKKSNPKHETGQEVDIFVRNIYGLQSNQVQLARLALSQLYLKIHVFGVSFFVNW